MFDHLLVAIDGTDGARRVAGYGVGLADLLDASVDLLDVRTDRADADDDERRDRMRDLLADVTGPDGPDVAVETHVLTGRPASVVTGFADERDADLVVMDRHGRTGLGDRLLGTTAERVLRTADRPVLTVPAGDADDGGWLPVSDVLLTTDGSETAERAVPHADAVARRCDATLHVLAAVDVQAEAGAFHAGGVDESFVEGLLAEGETAVERAADRVEGATVETAVVRGAPHEAIREYVADEGVDLIVMASEGQTDLAGQRLGSVAGRVLDSLDRPVLVVTIQT